MRFIKYFSLITAIVLLFLLCSCPKGGNNLTIATSPSDKSLIDLSSNLYNETQLLEIAEFNGSIMELNDNYPIECARENNGNYRVSYLGSTSIAVLLFDDLGHKLLGQIYNPQLLKSDFEKLTKDQVLEDVKAIDPNGEYLFLYTGRNDTPKVSSHYTKDGYLITIAYDDSNTIISIVEELI